MTVRLNQLPGRRAAAGPRGFTLIELMVSIAIVLVLILGVNSVFKIASDSVGAGDAYSTASRVNRSIQGPLLADFRAMVLMDAPFLVIESGVVPAFRNRQDQLADRDFDPNATWAGLGNQPLEVLTVDSDGNGIESPAEAIPPAVINYRNHRVDAISFFASDLFRRQTGNDGQFVADGPTWYEAFINYSHLRVYDGVGDPAVNIGPSGPNDGSYPAPGRRPIAAGGTPDPNPYNYFASDWILGRSQVLLATNLQDPAVVPGAPHHLTRISHPSTETDPNILLSPLTKAAPSTDRWKASPPFNGGTSYITADSRYDLAGTSIADMRQAMSRVNPAAFWHDAVSFRFFCNPNPTRPIRSTDVAQASPIFVRSCTQFMVEFAGDFLRQAPATGAIVGTYLDPTPQVDGVIDFIMDVDGVRRTRWYGMPRNVDFTDDLVNNGQPTILGQAGNINQLIDVVPLRDVLAVAGVTVLPTNFIERDVNNLMPSRANYAATPGGMVVTNRYVAAWHASQLAGGSLGVPKLFRITLAVDDPDGRMSDGQTYEYVVQPGL